MISGGNPSCSKTRGSEDLRLNEGKLQARRQDADDGERRAVERDRLAEDVLVAAETFLPEGVGQHRDVRAARPVFFRR